MKSAFTILLFSFIYFITTTSAWVTTPARGPENLDQRNRPPIPIEADIEQQRNRPSNLAPRSIRRHHSSSLSDDLDYTYLLGHITCKVDAKSPLALDVYAAISDLYNSNGVDNDSCATYAENIDDWDNDQPCSTLANYHSAKIRICSTLTKVDCNKVAGIAMMLVVECSRENNGELRVGGKVRMIWGDFFVVNDTSELRWWE